MLADYREHVIGVPQVFPDVTNADFDGPGANEDSGLEQVTGDPGDRYAFRTMPLRNAAVSTWAGGRRPLKYPGGPRGRSSGREG